jgi:hypothetical protein
VVDQTKEGLVAGRLDRREKALQLILGEIFGDWSHRIRIACFIHKVRFPSVHPWQFAENQVSSVAGYALKGAIELERRNAVKF